MSGGDDDERPFFESLSMPFRGEKNARLGKKKEDWINKNAKKLAYPSRAGCQIVNNSSTFQKRGHRFNVSG